jgi:hypothetical protein
MACHALLLAWRLAREGHVDAQAALAAGSAHADGRVRELAKNLLAPQALAVGVGHGQA